MELSDTPELSSSKREDILATFKKFDNNGDGLIDRLELEATLSKLDPSWTREHIDLLLRAADLNLDDRIDVDEFIRYLFAVDGSKITDSKIEEVRRKCLRLFSTPIWLRAPRTATDPDAENEVIGVESLLESAGSEIGDSSSVYLNIQVKQESSPYRCWHKLWMTSAKLDLIQSVTFSMPGQGFQEPVVTSTQAPFNMNFGPCWGLPHVSIQVLLKNGVALRGLFDNNLPSKDACIQLGQLMSSPEPPSNSLVLHVKALEETSPEFEYRCWHKLWLTSGQLELVQSVTFNMPGQGFSNPSVTSAEPPFVMQFGPCWGLPHVTIQVLLKDGTLLEDLYKQNLPPKDSYFPLGQLIVPTPPTLDRTTTAALTLSLAGLRAAEPSAVQVAVSNLKRHGFVFLDLHDDEILGQESILRTIHSFLAGPGRETGSRDALIGHISTAYKDSIRLLTGDQWPNNPKLPFSGGLQKLAVALDDAQLDVMKALATPLFGQTSIEAIAGVFDVSLLNSGFEPCFGLLDIVQYRMEPGGPSPMAVSEHVDPGLLILSLPQSSHGLELEDAGGEWRCPPPGFGVLWAGAKAAKAGVRGGRHRVRASETPRFSCWHEICTNDQITPPMLERIASQNMELQLGAVKGTKRVLRTLRKAEDHDFFASVHAGIRGAPMSKSGVSARSFDADFAYDSDEDL